VIKRIVSLGLSVIVLGAVALFAAGCALYSNARTSTVGELRFENENSPCSDDVPLVIQDKRLNEDGSLDFSQSWISPTGRLGDTILVNGTYAPYAETRSMSRPTRPSACLCASATIRTRTLRTCSTVTSSSTRTSG
jgi:hypothetical protein